MLFLGIATLMLSQVLVVFPHIRTSFFKYLLSLTCLLTMISFVIAQRSQPGYLKRFNSEQSNVVTLLRKVDPAKVCP